MHNKHTIFCLSIALAATGSAFAAPIHAVIGLNSSQVSESNQGISLTPNNATLLPLESDFSPLSLAQDKAQSNWINAVGSKVTVEHRQRELSYTGTLIKVEANANSFLLSMNNKVTQLPLSDFYLLSHNNKKTSHTPNYPANISYQTDQLSWTPQLSLIINNNNISFHQNAILHNNSDTSIQLENSLLHYSRPKPAKMFKAKRTTMALQSTSKTVEYENNEATYSLGNSIITLAPHTDTLYPLKNSTSKVEQALNSASLYTRSHSRGKIDLHFQSTLNFTFMEDGLPGQYQIYWQRDNLLVPSNKVFFKTVRAKQTASIVTNQSLDLTGELTLVSASSKSLPMMQVWEAKIRNNSSNTQHFSVEQNVGGILEQVEGGNTKKLSANSLMISGEVKGHSTKVIRYTLKLQK